ncbi:nucleotidyltransferase domain-containing protein [candidate division KSB3 bacterium]|uniref:Nucleotidyltransferase domain-containing protein n=1 Tax=candidate division KSB3 bacterium TaxID=2044937 RepID=A0A9D5JWN8_9BACT|nr:nucleotidyltransferase domain-containing protein [candidate division KSB3 bacterium]MBD3325519.1 nucleotidyltransferase domain-containing protein [candidate division KSB3 bacterium]
MHTHIQTQHDDILQRFVQTLQAQLGDHLRQVILFGSRARGDNAPDSDYDCLVIVDAVSPDLLNILDQVAGEFLYTYNRIFSVVPVSEKRHRQQIYNPLFMNVSKEGIPL